MATDYFDDTSQWTRNYAEEVKDKALDSIGDLQTAALNYFDVYWNSNSGDIDPGFAVSSQVILNWNPPNLPDVPDFILNATYRDLSTETYNNYVWDTEGETKIFDGIWNIINNQGVGLSQSLQDSIFNADRERKLLILNDTLTLINAQTGSRGFRRATSITGSQQNEVILKYQYDLENQSREITKLMEEHARTNLQFALEKGISFEAFHADFATNFNNLFLEMKKTAVQLYVSEIQAEVAVFEATVKGLVQKVELAKAEVSYFSTVGNVLIEKYKADIDQQNKKATLALETAKSNLLGTIQALHAAAATAGEVIKASSTNSISLSTVKQ